MKIVAYIFVVISVFLYSCITTNIDIKTTTKEMKEVSRIIAIKTGSEYVVSVQKADAKKTL